MKSGLAQRRGFSLLYMTVMMTAMLGIISLAVDLGRVQVAKTQLRQAADAAARYAVTGLADGTYLSKAQASASENTVDGSSVALQTGDVQIGRWANGTFTAGITLPNSVQVTMHRSAARGTAVPLGFASLIGRSSCDVSASSVTTIASSGGGNALVGLANANISTSGTVDSYNSNVNDYSAATALAEGNVASNGTLSLGNGVKVKGDAFYRSAYVTSGGGGVVAPGHVYYNSGDISYDNPVLPSSYTYYGAFSANSGNYTVTAGNYYFSSVSLSGTVNVTFSGQVNIYVGGPVSISGNVSTTGGNPGNFRIMTTAASTVNITNSSSFAADIYCPNSAVTIGGTGTFYGRAIGNTLAVSGSLNYHYDEALNTASTGGAVSLVK